MPRLCVLVRAMGVVSRPDSSIQWQPESSPFPFRLNTPAYMAFSTISSAGRTTVTPVRAMPSTGPAPSLMTVECPTRTPLTSVTALYSPQGNPPMRAMSLILMTRFLAAS